MCCFSAKSTIPLPQLGIVRAMPESLPPGLEMVPSRRAFEAEPAALGYKFGGTHDFDGFFDSILQSIGEAALRSYLVKHYIFMDVVLTAAQFVSDLGGNVDEVIRDP
jgi:hypothetical protein